MNRHSFSGESLPPAVRHDIPMIATSSYWISEVPVGGGTEDAAVGDEELDADRDKAGVAGSSGVAMA